MSQSVPLSDELIRDAREAAEARAGSVDDQIERWARLGRAVERLLSSSAGAKDSDRLSQRLSTVDTEAGRRRVTDVLQGRPFPHYEPAPDAPGVVIRIDEDGTRTRGRFVGRQFRAAP